MYIARSAHLHRSFWIVSNWSRLQRWIWINSSVRSLRLWACVKRI